MKTKTKKWTIWGIIFYVHSVFLLALGIDRVNGYNSGEYSSDLSKHVYVGGDAYNYIINSNMLTAFFVLSASFFVAGTMLIVTGSIIKAIKTNQAQTPVQQVVKQEPVSAQQ